MGVLLGLAAMMLTEFFWPAVGLIYLSALVALVDLFIEKTISKWAKAIIGLVIISVIGAFSHYIVFFYPTPDVKCSWFKADYPTGSNIDGLTWRPGLSKVIVTFRNTTQRDYIDLDLSISTNEAVVGIVQKTSIPCMPLQENPVTISDSMSNVWLPLGIVGTERFRCPNLPRHSSIQFVLAIANIDDLLKGAPPPSLFGPKRKPQWVTVTGAYRVTYHPYSGGIKITDIPEG